MRQKILERHHVGGGWWAVFSGCEGETPCLEALVREERLAQLLVTTDDPTPGEDGRKLVFDGDIEPALVPDVEATISNDFEVDTLDLLRAAIEEQEPDQWVITCEGRPVLFGQDVDVYSRSDAEVMLRLLRARNDGNDVLFDVRRLAEVQEDLVGIPRRFLSR